MIIKECIEIIVNKYATLIQEVVIKNLVIGRHFTAVELSDGSCGLANTGTPVRTVKQHSGKRFSGDFAPGNYCGREVLDLLQFQDDDRIPLSVTLAVMNAISTQLLKSSCFRILDDADPLDVLDIDKHKSVTLVGAFDSYIRKILTITDNLHVIELHSEAVPREYLDLFVPFEKAETVLSSADIVIMTGSTIVNETFDQLLSMTNKQAVVAVVGPSSNLLPEVLFGKGVSCIGGTIVTDAEMMFRIIAEGGSGYHLFGRCAHKICIIKD